MSGDEEMTQLASQESPAAHVGGDVPERLGRFVILDRVGEGGMGVVYRARDPSLDRDVAIKIVPPARGDAEARERLLREAQALARLAHPNVVSV
jgi:eukaryotic-like serine/threonine-protein kinase